jgi:hypothetical protein
MTSAAGRARGGLELVYACKWSEEIWEIKTPGAIARQSERGRRRTRQDQISLWGFGPGEIAELKETRTERRKPVSSAGPALKEQALPKYDPAV